MFLFSKNISFITDSVTCSLTIKNSEWCLDAFVFETSTLGDQTKLFGRSIKTSRGVKF